MRSTGSTWRWPAAPSAVALASVSGDLDDWPFKHQEGRFEARGAYPRRRDSFPARVAADGEGRCRRGVHRQRLRAAGRARWRAWPWIGSEAGIGDFAQGQLSVRAHTGSDASRLLAMLRQSPLHKSYGETLDNLVASGLTDTSFDLLLLLHGGTGGHLKGQVALQGAKLADNAGTRPSTRSRARPATASDGFAAEGLSVRRQRQSGHPRSARRCPGEGSRSGLRSQLRLAARRQGPVRPRAADGVAAALRGRALRNGRSASASRARSLASRRRPATCGWIPDLVGTTLACRRRWTNPRSARCRPASMFHCRSAAARWMWRSASWWR